MERTVPAEITLNVNGREHRVLVEPDTPLLYVLRNDLGLKGAKLGCGLGQCGACTVLVDGKATPSCRLPVHAVRGREITTVEGLGTPQDPHPLQEAFVAEGAAQCGYCTAGMVVAAAALLDQNPCPSDQEVRAHLHGNLCRCGTHERVLRAIRRVAGQPARLPQQAVVLDTPLQGDALALGDQGLPRPLAATPDLDAWVAINEDGTVTLYSGKAELGQGLRTAIAMIGADELDVSLERVCVVMADTARTPDEGYTVSSMSLETSGNAIRYAAAEARRIVLSVAHEELEAPIERLTIEDGTITDPATGRSTTYWDLVGGQRFGAQASGSARPKGSGAYEVVGHPATRLDLLDKVTGQHRFVHDLELRGADGSPMVHGRVVLPPRYGSRLASVDEAAARELPGVLQVVRDGSFLGVIAEREEQAVRAMSALQESAVWEPGPELPQQDALFDDMLGGPGQAFLVVEGTPTADPVPPVATPEEAAKTVSATYCRPYHMHASLGPSAAAAEWTAAGLTVWTHSQGVYPLRGALAQVLGLPEERIHALHVDGPGCYGHNGADDVALDAALLARAVPGRPVLCKWTRAQENAWEPYGPATAVQMHASLDEGGNVIDWSHDVWGYTHSGRPRGGGETSALASAWHLQAPFVRPQAGPSRWHEVGIHRNANPLYTFPGRRIVKHYLPEGPLRVSALRGLGSYANVFALESFLDEVARAAGVDPVAMRLRYLDDGRARAVIEAAVEQAGRRHEGLGRGVAFAQYKNRQAYVAVVVDLSVDRDSGEIHLARAVVAADAGQIVHPEGLRNQLEGAFLQAASWTLFEEVGYGPHGITSTDWRSYPILRFSDAPEVEVVLLNRPGYPFLGVGEGAQGPASAAIANAVYDAAGVRLRRIPFTPQRVRAALGAV